MFHTKGCTLKRKTAALLCAMFLLSPASGAHAATIEYTVTASKVNIRKEASVSSSVVTVVRQGDTVQLISADGDGWLKVSTSSGSGYLSADYACLTALSGSGATATVLAEKLNIRSTASTSGKILTVARRGAELDILALSDGWLQVKYSGKTGYVSPEYVALDANGNTSVTVTAAPTQAPSATEVPSIGAVLEKGDRGSEVKALQQKLISLGYLTGTADGVFGNDTVSAVKAFQRDHGLIADGVAGASTLAALASAVATPVPTPAPTATPAPAVSALQKGDRGSEVKALQQKLISLGYLTGTADGIFGNGTLNAVKAFQRAAGLAADGVAGASTLNALTAAMATPVPTPTPTATPAPSVLQKGDRGDAVRTLQQKLIALGYLAGSADGIFGNDTRDAVKAFQRNAGLDDDGVVGATTYAALSAATVVPSNPGADSNSSSSATLDTTALLKKGSRGEQVMLLQEKLIFLEYMSGAATGYFGDDTRDAVKAFQRDKGLTVDGIAGTSTLAALSSAMGGSGGSSGGTPDSVLSGVTLLKYGDKGEAVEALQTRLKELGYFSGSIGGNFGSLTRDAVKAFQEAVGLTNDGMAGEQTLNALFASDAPENSTTTLRVGDSGDAVREMQQRLKELGYLTGSVDGKFGSGTQAAVMAFQSAAGLNADGVAGTGTLNALYSDDAPEKPATSDDGSSTSAVAEKIIATAKKYLGCKYVYACEDPPYFDCSGLTQYVFKQYGYSLLRTAYQQGYNDQYQKLTMSQLRMGDLVFFNTNLTDSDQCDHTGIYIGNGDFIHASSSAGKVVINNLNSGYYNTRFSWGRRILTD